MRCKSVTTVNVCDEKLSYEQRRDHVHFELKKTQEHIIQLEISDIAASRQHRLNIDRIKAQR